MNPENFLFNPTDIDMSRSSFDQSPTVTGSCLAGRLIPVKSWEILPGDSVKMDCRSLIKMATPVYPTMDQLFCDVFFFFVPNKLVLSSRYGSPDLNESNRTWDAFVGAQVNAANMPVPTSGLTLPRLGMDATYRAAPQSLTDYFGYPLFKGLNLKINALDALAYFSIWNENFRDESTMDPVLWSYSTDAGTGLDYITPSNFPEMCAAGNETLYNTLGQPQTYGQWGYCFDPVLASNATYWSPFPVCRFHGYFGSALPWPQRNLTGVSIPLTGSAPVYSGLAHSLAEPGATVRAVTISQTDGTALAGSSTIQTTPAGNVMLAGQSTGYNGQGTGLVFSNLYANLDEAVNANINALRAAVQQQRWYEHLARSGNRPDELEYGLFGVRPHDSGDDRPQYLGGKRIPLCIEMVASTEGGTNPGSAQGAGSLGTLGAFSHTNDSDHYFYHSFDAWGTLMCLIAIRHHDSFSQALDRRVTRATREDFYWPTFAHLGCQAILKREIEFIDVASHDDAVFGYTDAWDEYRYDPDKVVGLVRPNESLGFMTYANTFGGGIGLKRFLNASTHAHDIDRTLAVSSLTSGFQFIYQFTFDYKIRRCMPTFSEPGFVDHF